MTTVISPPDAGPRPMMSEIDVFGVTHRGLVRETNNDHFLIASIHRHLRIHHTSVTSPLGDLETQSRGFILLVADGVGGLSSAGDGGALVVRVLTEHLLHATELSSQILLTDESGAAATMREAVLKAHATLLEEGVDGGGRPATTLTMFAAFWPRAFIVHVGDSRYYRLRDGKLERFTSDQTYEQLMLESGAIKPGSAEAERLKNVLWSAIGSEEIVLQVIPTDLARRDISLLCTDGLTKHVSDDEIRECLLRDLSAEATCTMLRDLALARGGTDNVTVVVGRGRRPTLETPAI